MLSPVGLKYRASFSPFKNSNARSTVIPGRLIRITNLTAKSVIADELCFPSNPRNTRPLVALPMPKLPAMPAELQPATTTTALRVPS